MKNRRDSRLLVLAKDKGSRGPSNSNIEKNDMQDSNSIGEYCNECISVEDLGFGSLGGFVNDEIQHPYSEEPELPEIQDEELDIPVKILKCQRHQKNYPFTKQSRSSKNSGDIYSYHPKMKESRSSKNCGLKYDIQNQDEEYDYREYDESCCLEDKSSINLTTPKTKHENIDLVTENSNFKQEMIKLQNKVEEIWKVQTEISETKAPNVYSSETIEKIQKLCTENAKFTEDIMRLQNEIKTLQNDVNVSLVSQLKSTSRKLNNNVHENSVENGDKGDEKLAYRIEMGGLEVKLKAFEISGKFLSKPMLCLSFVCFLLFIMSV